MPILVINPINTIMEFKLWLMKQEDVNLGGLEPPMERPIDAAVKKGQCGAFPTYTDDKSDLPPTPKRTRMKKQVRGF